MGETGGCRRRVAYTYDRAGRAMTVDECSAHRQSWPCAADLVAAMELMLAARAIQSAVASVPIGGLW